MPHKVDPSLRPSHCVVYECLRQYVLIDGGSPSKQELARGSSLSLITVYQSEKILKEKGCSGRLSTWPVPVAMMATVASTEYAMKVIDGQVPFDKLNVPVLEKDMANYAKVKVSTTPYIDEAGKKYPTYLFVLMDFLTY